MDGGNKLNDKNESTINMMVSMGLTLTMKRLRRSAIIFLLILLITLVSDTFLRKMTRIFLLPKMTKTIMALFLAD